MELRNRANNKDLLFNIVVVGTGATGSQLMPPLTQLLSNLEGHRLSIIDADHVEEKNLKNQKFLKEDIGKSKAQVIQKR